MNAQTIAVDSVPSIAQFTHDNVVHFYQRQALDWVNVVRALEADPKATSRFARSISGYARSSSDYFAEIQQRLRNVVESGRPGPFASGYCGHSDYRLPPELDLVVMAHYLESLAWQRRIAPLQTLFGGGSATSTSVNEPELRKVAELIALMREFVAQVYVPDLLAIGRFYKDWFTRGHAMETGPPARVLMMYDSGHAGTVALVDQSLAMLGLPFDALYSVMGRNLGRALECQILTEALPAWAAEPPANIEAEEARAVRSSVTWGCSVR